MKLNYNDKKKLLQKFPSIELSYEKKIHKKIHNEDFCILFRKVQNSLFGFILFMEKIYVYS